MKTALEKYRKELESIKEAGTWKGERIITTPQRSRKIGRASCRERVF